MNLRYFILLPLLATLHAGIFEDGMLAKRDGRHEQAAELLARAVAQEPEKVEAWYHYATVLGWLNRFDQAEKAYDQGLALAPKDFDLCLGRARLMAWRGNLEQADVALSRLEDQYPGNLEVMLMRGRVAQWREQPHRASEYYRAILAKDPDHVDALLGMGDLAAAGGRKDEARRYFEQSKDLDPSPDVLSRLEALDGRARWRLDAVASFSTFRKSARSDWWGGLLQVTRMTEGASQWMQVQHEERFGFEDTILSLGLSEQLNQELVLGMTLGGAPDADWAHRWMAMVDLGWKPLDDGPQWVLDAKRSQYRNGGVWIVRPGIIHDFEGFGEVEARWIRINEQGADGLDGFLLALHRPINEELWLRLGVARGAETITGNNVGNNRTLKSRSAFIGLGGQINEDYSWRVDFEKELVRGAPDRNGFAIGVQRRF